MAFLAITVIPALVLVVVTAAAAGKRDVFGHKLGNVRSVISRDLPKGTPLAHVSRYV